MDFKSIQECEQRKMDKLFSYKLPNYWKKIGAGFFIITLITILTLKFLEGEFTLVKEIVKRVMLLSLFIIVLAREKHEDERIQHLRARAFSMTFLITAVYILIQPVVTTIVRFILNKEIGLFEDLGDFSILWYMLFVYIMFFHLSKKNR
ncbi:MAG: hypothetical protein CMC70_05335 [Flavobacteriaceae bacterium]|nr:hypothetical protein [Flavobacteriaceae bacterium]